MKETDNLLSTNNNLSNFNYIDYETNLSTSPPKKSLYKNPHYMSASAFDTLNDEIERQKNIVNKLSRSASADMLHSLNPTVLEKDGRRTLYGTLPFVGIFGMQHREGAIRKVISHASCHTLLELEQNELKKIGELDNIAQQVDVDEIIFTLPLLFSVLVAIIAQFLVGYNTGVMNAPESVVFPGHTTTEWSIAVSAFAIGGPGGAMLGGYLANKIGRRGAIMFNTWIFAIGGALMTFAMDIYWLIPARLIIGFASGVSSVVVPVYLGEIAPPTLRGTLGTCTQFSMVIGILVSNLLAFPLSTLDRWRYLFAITPLLCIIQGIVSPFLLESPRWLLNQDEKSIEARLVIKKLRGFRSDTDVEDEVEHFLFAASKHKTKRSSAHSSDAMWDLIMNKDIRKLVISSVLLQMAQQLCGINAVFYYSTGFFSGILDNPLIGTVVVSLVNVIATYIALKIMDTTGRRTLLLWSSGGMLISTILIITSLLGLTYNCIALFAVMSFVTFFEVGLGPIPWLIVAEMFDSKYVATVMSLACIVNWSCNFLVGFLFPFILESLGPWSFGPFGVILLFTFIFSYYYLPETHGRTVEEINKIVSDDDIKLLEVINSIEY